MRRKKYRSLHVIIRGCRSGNSTIHNASRRRCLQTSHPISSIPPSLQHLLSWICFGNLRHIQKTHRITLKSHQRTGFESFNAIFTSDTTFLHATPTDIDEQRTIARRNQRRTTVSSDRFDGVYLPKRGRPRSRLRCDVLVKDHSSKSPRQVHTCSR